MRGYFTSVAWTWKLFCANNTYKTIQTCLYYECWAKVMKEMSQTIHPCMSLTGTSLETGHTAVDVFRQAIFLTTIQEQ